MASTGSAQDTVADGKNIVEGSRGSTSEKEASGSYAGMASSAAGSAAETATNAAVGVKDTMFSMFGGGAKKEVKDDTKDEAEDRSGSAKALKEKEKEKEIEKPDRAKEAGNDDDGVIAILSFILNHLV